MAWHSHTLASTFSADQIGLDTNPRELLQQGQRPDFVYASSRGGVLLGTLSCICTRAAPGSALYLLQDSAVVSGDRTAAAARDIENLLSEIERNPDIVVEATRQKHTPVVVLHNEGFTPLVAEVVYSSTSLIEDGWVYPYSQEEVRAALQRASASQNPCPQGDDDGESLEYVFAFLKSHLALLGLAAESGLVVVYAELNPP